LRIAFYMPSGPRDAANFGPLGVAYLAAYLREEGFDAKCSLEPDLESLLTVAPDVIGISCASSNYGRAIEAAHAARERCPAKIVIGGPHISRLPASFTPAFDAGVVGEGEETFAHLIATLERAGDLPPAELAHVPGIVYWDGARPVLTAPRAPFEPLDGLPPPLREILPPPPERVIHIQSGRGRLPDETPDDHWDACRLFGADRVAAELLEAMNADFERIHIIDETFIDDPARLVRIGDILEEENALGLARLSCVLRADLLTDWLAEIFVRLGVEWVELRLRADDEPAARRALAILDTCNIACRAVTTVAAPNQSLDAMRRTYSFAAEQLVQGRLSAAQIEPCAPEPGDATWNLAVERGLLGDLAAFDWSRLVEPWRGLWLNPEAAANAARLAAWDAHVRATVAALHRPTILIAPDEADLDLEADPSAVRAILLLADEPEAEELLDGGEIEMWRLGLGPLRAQLTAWVERLGAAPLVLFAPDSAQATPAVVRACKLALTLRRLTFVRSRAGAFPLLAVCAEVLKLSDEQFLALARGDAQAAPADVAVAEPQELRRLPEPA